MKKWKILGQETVCDFKLFKFYRRDLLNTHKNSEHHFYVMETPDWINVIPVTPEGKIVLIRQYRAGTDEVTVEIPGGVIDKKDASPEAAARRELEEETAYVSDDLALIGSVYPNPSFMANTCYFVVARDAKPVGKTHFDPGEDIETFEMMPEELRQAILSGKIKHALTVAALGLFFQGNNNEF
jgi:ADP-ribose pyrophosphatase